MDFYTAFATLFLVMDPIGNIPALMALLKNVPRERRTPLLARELLFALFILICFLILGDHLFTFFGFTQEAISIAGAIVLFLVAIRMIFPIKEKHDDEVPAEPFLVPIAVPLIAGPSSLAVVLLMRHSFTGSFPALFGAVGLAWGLSAVIILAGYQLSNYLGERFLLAMESLMGMLLVILSVQMFLNGIRDFLEKI